MLKLLTKGGWEVLFIGGTSLARPYKADLYPATQYGCTWLLSPYSNHNWIFFFVSLSFFFFSAPGQHFLISHLDYHDIACTDRCAEELCWASARKRPLAHLLMHGFLCARAQIALRECGRCPTGLCKVRSSGRPGRALCNICACSRLSEIVVHFTSVESQSRG